nr:MAG TPA: hypothetical protein [Caudoviricetes sp.]
MVNYTKRLISSSIVVNSIDKMLAGYIMVYLMRKSL